MPAHVCPVGDATNELLSENQRLHNPRLRAFREADGPKRTKVVWYWLPEDIDDDVRPDVIPESADRLSKRPSIGSTSADPQPKAKRAKRRSKDAGNVPRRLI